MTRRVSLRRFHRVSITFVNRFTQDLREHFDACRSWVDVVGVETAAPAWVMRNMNKAKATGNNRLDLPRTTLKILRSERRFRQFHFEWIQCDGDVTRERPSQPGQL